MKALIVREPGKPEVAEVEKPVPGPHDIVAKVLHCGICGTDLSIVDGTLNLGKGNDPIYPVRLGHEWSGIVEEVGNEVRIFKKGDRVISDSGVYCGECDNCKAKNFESCTGSRSIGTIRNAWPGAFAEYMKVPVMNAFKIPDIVAADEAALVEPAGIGLSGILKANLESGKTFLVIGTGAISLGALVCARGIGAGKIILAGRKDLKLEIGKKMGADVTVNMSREDLTASVQKETGGRGADAVLDATGAAELLNLSVSLCIVHGKIIIPGFYEKPVDGFLIDNMVANGRSLVGTAGRMGIPARILNLLEYRRINLKPMITARYPFEKVLDAFAVAKAKKDTMIKVMVDF
jgi:2-desacetyl-2-hydroxyethyl bacteriochlorophyllide A dehydrogenase